MSNIESVIIKTEDTGVEEETDSSSSITTITTEESENDSEAPANCCDRLFGVNYLNCDGIHIKTEAGLKPEETNFKSRHLVHSRYRIEYRNKTPYTDLVCKPEKFFDANSSRDRLKCPNCYFLTDNKGNLKQHMKVHQKPRGDKIYKCQLCNFETKYKNSITGHVLRHEVTKLKTEWRKPKYDLGTPESL